MTPRSNYLSPAVAILGCQAVEITVGQLFGQVYAAASPNDRLRLLEHLNQANARASPASHSDGNFNAVHSAAKASSPCAPGPDPRAVEVSDVVELFDRVQRASHASKDGLARVVAASPMLAGTAAATLLMAVWTRDLKAKTARSETSAADQATSAAIALRC